MQLVAAAGVGPDFGEGYLARGSLLQEQLFLRVEEENTEGAVEHTLRLRRVEPAELSISRRTAE